MIEIKNVSKTFGDRTIVSDVSAEFLPSNTSLIIGSSGTGKSVLLKCIVGLLPPDPGSQVLFDGRDLIAAPLAERKQIRREIGMLFQGSALFDSMTVEENVRFPLDVMDYTMSESEKRDRVNFCLSRVGLEGSNKKKPSEISGGMQKRVGIARAIVMNPRYLFCDEPNSGLDPQTSIRIDNLISELTDEYKTTTVVVTHDMNSVMGIGEYILFLHQGLKNWEGTSDTILSTSTPELDDFIFASKVMRNLKKTQGQW